ncbi:MAG: histidine phosphatase family protein [Anaerolineae bacterium]|nr:histidine phosphatase family protein [Anaerolineae bacterium]
MKTPGDKETRVVLMRHGETEWNRVERFRGRIDIDLNETGRRQALLTAQRLSGWQIGAIYSSPLQRALQTAQPIAEACGLRVAILEGMTDVDYGVWAGLSAEEARAQYPEVYETWVHTPLLARFAQGESLRQVQDRAWSALEGISSGHEGETILLVSHVVVNRVLICSALGLVDDAFWRVGQDNAAINVLQGANGRYRVLLLNDTCHLESLDGSVV